MSTTPVESSARTSSAANVRVNTGRRVSLFGFYVLNYANSDASSGGSAGGFFSSGTTSAARLSLESIRSNGGLWTCRLRCAPSGIYRWECFIAVRFFAKPRSSSSILGSPTISPLARIIMETPSSTTGRGLQAAVRMWFAVPKADFSCSVHQLRTSPNQQLHRSIRRNS